MFLTKPISLRLRLHPVYYKYGYMSCQSFIINMNVKLVLIENIYNEEFVRLFVNNNSE